MKGIENILSFFSKGSKRSILIKKNIIASFFIKGWSALVQFLLVPLTLACLGEYENGVWLTISSVLLWINNLDIGLGNGLRNKLAVYMARGDNDKAREMVSSTFIMLCIIITPVLIILLLFEVYSDNYRLFNVDIGLIGNLDIVLYVATILVCATFIFKFIGNFYMGLQLPSVNNFIGSIGSTLALLGTFIIYLFGNRSLLLVASVNLSAPLLVYLLAFPITFMGKYKFLSPSFKYIKKTSIREIFSIGFKFFALQIPAVLLFFTSNILISKLFNPAMVTPYQIAYRYFVMTMTLFSIICVPYWTATTDAYEKRDFEWIRRANRTLNRFVLLLFFIIVCMILLSRPVYSVWIGDNSDVPFSMTVIAGLYQFLLIYSMRYSYVLNGIGALRLQLIFTRLAAAIYIPLATLVCHLTHDINYLLLVMCVVHVPGLVVNIIQYHKIMNGTAKGIWIK